VWGVFEVWCGVNLQRNKKRGRREKWENTEVF